MIFNRQSLCWALALGCVLPIAAPAQSDSNDEAAQYGAAGQKALAQGHYDEAQADFESLAKLDPNVAEVHATLAVIYFKQRKYDVAVSEIQAAQKLKPTLPKLGSLLGLSLSELGKFSQALPRLEKGFKQTADPEVKRMCGLQLLRAYSGLSRDADAVQTAVALTRLYPDDPEVLYHTGRIYGNFAYIAMERLREKARGSVWMFQAQGEANESLKNYDAAIIGFNQVLQIDSRRPGIHYRLGRVYLSRFKDLHNPDDRQNSNREFLAELEVNPGNGNAAYELAQMAADDNDMEEARKQYEALVSRFPDFEQALVGLGGVYLQDKLGNQAVAVLTRATNLNSGDEVAWYRLAQAERSTGNREASAKALGKFRTLYAMSSAGRSPVAVDEVTPQQLGSDVNP
jgi:tetratricopeptide (TPR) repeat protein